MRNIVCGRMVSDDEGCSANMVLVSSGITWYSFSTLYRKQLCKVMVRVENSDTPLLRSMATNNYRKYAKLPHTHQLAK